ncbi:hypothetical protein D3C80_989020 [compost metagenome]
MRLRLHGGVGQDDDGRLQPLGAVDGHDADLAARAFQFALHLDVGGFQQGEAGLQIDPAPVLGGQHLIEGFVNGLLGLAAQTGEDAGAARDARVVHPVQQGREEGEGIAVARRAGAQAQLQGAAPFGAFVGAGLQFAPQALTLLAPGQVIERGLVHVAEGAAQHLGQRQVVAGEEGEAGQGLQVVENDVATELQPVGPGDGHPGALQGADDLFKRRVAAAD